MDERHDWHLTEAIRHEAGRGDPFAAAIRGTRMPMVIADARKMDNPIVFANKAFQDLTGYERAEILGRNCRFLQGRDTNAEAVQKISAAIAARTDVQVDILNYRKDGSAFWNALFLSPVRSESGEVQFFFASQLDVTDRVDAQSQVSRQKSVVEAEVEERTAALEAALEAKTLLLHEVDHRVKNNLTMIGSLLRLQARSLPDPAMGATLNSMLERVDALATVHRRLYQSDDITKLDVGALAETLAHDVVGSSGRSNIEVAADIEPIHIPSSHAAAVGLIINELLTNAVKHAFADGRGGRLSLIARVADGSARVMVRDDGPGMPEDDRRLDGLGRTLIGRLSRQINARTEWSSAPTGTTATLAFPFEARL